MSEWKRYASPEDVRVGMRAQWIDRRNASVWEIVASDDEAARAPTRKITIGAAYCFIDQLEFCDGPLSIRAQAEAVAAREGAEVEMPPPAPLPDLGCGPGEPRCASFPHGHSTTCAARPAWDEAQRREARRYDEDIPGSYRLDAKYPSDSELADVPSIARPVFACHDNLVDLADLLCPDEVTHV